MSETLLAWGRDAEVFEVGPRLVLRRRHGGRSLECEAEVMEHVRRQGFPVPRVEELRAHGTELVMERLGGPSMMEMLLRRPWRLVELARTLAELHSQLGAIEAPLGLRQISDGGDAVLHLDLHPLNVIMTNAGPYVIDWTSAARGQPKIDVASTWVIMRSSEIPGSALESILARCGRRRFLQAFLHHSDKEAAARVLPSVIAGRLDDPHLTDAERRFLTRWAAVLAA